MGARRSLPAAPIAAKEQRVTINDVAREAGVSKATVSRFLNRQDVLTRELADRVEAAIARLGYTPSPMAQALKSGTTRLIGLVVADVTNPYSVAVLSGAERACRDAGYLLMLFNIGNDDVREREALAALASYQVDGFILHAQGNDAGELAETARRGKPVVLVDRRLGDAQVDLVALDNVAAVNEAVAHLQAAGYRHLVYVTEPLRNMTREERATAFRACLRERPDLTSQFIELGPQPQLTLAQPLADLRARTDLGPVAVLSANAVATLQVAQAASSLQWPLGTGLGLIGIDDPPWNGVVGPGITAIAQPTDDLGRLAAHCLIERLQGLQLPPRHIRLAGTLVPRGSTRLACA